MNKKQNLKLQFTRLGVDKMRILPEKLIDAGCGKKYDEGYRIVYFEKDDRYSLGAYCKTIEGFMIGFADCNPINDEDDISSFISVDDILNRSLNLYDDVIRVSIYKTDGLLVATKERKNLNRSK